MLQVMNREDRPRGPQRRSLERGVEQHGHEPGRPIVAMHDIRNPVGGQAGIQRGAGVESGAFAGILSGRVDLAGAVEIVVFDEPGFELRRDRLGADAAGALAGIAVHADLERLDERAHLRPPGDGAIQRRHRAHLMTPCG